MKLPTASTARFFLLIVIFAMALPISAGGIRSKSTMHRGHGVNHHGVASFYRNSRGLPNGVSIFNRGSRSLHVHASKRPMNGRAGKKPGKAKHRSHRQGKTRDHEHAGNDKHRRITKRRHARSDKDRHDNKKLENRKHKRDEGNRVIYASSAYVFQPTDEYVITETGDDRDCRYLTERGYDLSGRRVLVEWTLCFDERGEVYVPEDGRRIVARY